jgi:hypothetical protein
MKLAIGIFLGLFSVGALAATPETATPWSPGKGVLCDKYICADASGVSIPLTEKYVGKTRADKLKAMGEFDTTAFTFATGLSCDVKEKLCRQDRYYGADGKRSGKINKYYTKVLFGSF